MELSRKSSNSCFNSTLRHFQSNQVDGKEVSRKAKIGFIVEKLAGILDMPQEKVSK